MANPKLPSYLADLPIIVPGTTTRLAITGDNAQAAASGILRLQSNVDCFVAFGKNPTAAVDTGMPLKADKPEYVAVVPGDKLAAIAASTGGYLYITHAS